jgi:flavin reductase (DIM6/NTAB) family NADH-FMN oxidoreductase RutF
VSEAGDFDTLMGRLSYPMWIFTVQGDGEPSGCLVGFASQVSIEPGRFLICISKENHTFDVVSRAAHVGVHLPPAEDRRLATLFGGETGDDVDKFAAVSWEDGPEGVPLLADVADRFVGRVVDRVDLGDHVGLVLDPIHVEVGPDRPFLTFPQVAHLDAGHDA